MQVDRRSSGERRKGNPLNQARPPYLTREGLILTDRRAIPDRRRDSFAGNPLR
jgi:hypothetical protein